MWRALVGCEVVKDPEVLLGTRLKHFSDQGKKRFKSEMWDMLAVKSVDEYIRKARRVFFHYGSIGAFQGGLSPLSPRSFLATCVTPVLMYGRENCVMTPALMEKEEFFQAEFVKRVLRWLRHHSNTAPLVAIGAQSMKSWILERKLGFQQQVLSADQKILSGRVVESWCNSITSLCLVKEYGKAVWSAVHRGHVERRAGVE